LHSNIESFDDLSSFLSTNRAKTSLVDYLNAVLTEASMSTRDADWFNLFFHTDNTLFLGYRSVSHLNGLWNCISIRSKYFDRRDMKRVIFIILLRILFPHAVFTVVILANFTMKILLIWHFWRALSAIIASKTAPWVSWFVQFLQQMAFITPVSQFHPNFWSRRCYLQLSSWISYPHAVFAVVMPANFTMEILLIFKTWRDPSATIASKLHLTKTTFISWFIIL